jgi:hypothetical protein
VARDLDHVLVELRARGLLLAADAELPSVATIVAGEKVRGSWWRHPKAHAVFAACEALAERPDVLATKLVGGKVTYVHRALWPPLLAVARAGLPWQRRGLSRAARSLLRAVEARGCVRTDQLRALLAPPDLARAARELEARLLVRAAEVHTDRGAHAKVLETWARWSARARWKAPALPAAAAQARLAQAVGALAAGADPERLLPWGKRAPGRG